MAKYCENCGRPLREGEVCHCSSHSSYHPSSSRNYSPEWNDEGPVRVRKSHTGLVVLITLACVAIIALCGTLIYSNVVNNQRVAESQKAAEDAAAAAAAAQSGDNTDQQKSGGDTTINVNIPENSGSTSSGSSGTAQQSSPSSSSSTAASSSYIFPDSNSRKLSGSELQGLSKTTLRYARNEIYARHGRRFNDASLQNYFNGKSWYSGSISPDSFNDNVLNSVERYNIELIKSYE